jgi:hypothetical protein
MRQTRQTGKEVGRSHVHQPQLPDRTSTHVKIVGLGATPLANQDLAAQDEIDPPKVYALPLSVDAAQEVFDFAVRAMLEAQYERWENALQSGANLPIPDSSLYTSAAYQEIYQRLIDLQELDMTALPDGYLGKDVADNATAKGGSLRNQNGQLVHVATLSPLVRMVLNNTEATYADSVLYDDGAAYVQRIINATIPTYWNVPTNPPTGIPPVQPPLPPNGSAPTPPTPNPIELHADICTPIFTDNGVTIGVQTPLAGFEVIVYGNAPFHEPYPSNLLDAITTQLVAFDATFNPYNWITGLEMCLLVSLAEVGTIVGIPLTFFPTDFVRPVILEKHINGDVTTTDNLWQFAPDKTTDVSVSNFVNVVGWKEGYYDTPHIVPVLDKDREWGAYPYRLWQFIVDAFDIVELAFGQVQNIKPLRLELCGWQGKKHQYIAYFNWQGCQIMPYAYPSESLLVAVDVYKNCAMQLDTLGVSSLFGVSYIQYNPNIFGCALPQGQWGAPLRTAASSMWCVVDVEVNVASNLKLTVAGIGDTDVTVPAGRHTMVLHVDGSYNADGNHVYNWQLSSGGSPAADWYRFYTVLVYTT